MLFLLVGIDVHILIRIFFFPKHSLDTEDQHVYTVFPFFDCWDFHAVSLLEGVKGGMQIPSTKVCMHKCWYLRNLLKVSWKHVKLLRNSEAAQVSLRYLNSLCRSKSNSFCVSQLSYLTRLFDSSSAGGEGKR